MTDRLNQFADIVENLIVNRLEEVEVDLKPIVILLLAIVASVSLGMTGLILSVVVFIGLTAPKKLTPEVDLV